MSFVSLLRKTVLALVRELGQVWVVSMILYQMASHLKALSEAQYRSFLSIHQDLLLFVCCVYMPTLCLANLWVVCP